MPRRPAPPIDRSARTWAWVVSANFAEGLPYTVLCTLLVAVLADMQLSAVAITTWTGLIALPWACKALWSPWVEAVMPCRRWMVLLQMAMAVTFGLCGLLLPYPAALVALCFVCALLSATYDVACDGFYMQALSSGGQSYFVGIRSTAYRMGWLLASGGLVALCGWISRGWALPTVTAWRLVFAIIAFLMVALGVLHSWLLPHPYRAMPTPTVEACPAPSVLSEEQGGANVATDSAASGRSSHQASPRRWWAANPFLRAVGSFLASRSLADLGFLLLFLFTYRLGEALLSKVTILFLKAPVVEGGMGLDNEQYGILYGTLGVLALIGGGIVGGMAVSRWGLRRCLVPMTLMLNVPDLLYVWLASTVEVGGVGVDHLMPQIASAPVPPSLAIIGCCIAAEQLGYGFGFTAYMVYMLSEAQGEHATAHYAFLTALMAIGMTLPSMLSGWLLEGSSYLHFFWTACAFTLPSFAMAVWYLRRTSPRPSMSHSTSLHP